METKIAFSDRGSNAIENARSLPLARAINAFMASPKGLMLIALVTVLAHLASLEIVMYVLTLLYCIYVCICGDDFLTLAPLCVFCYIVPSRENNPGRSNETLFSGGTGVFLLIAVAVLVICFLLRVRYDRNMGFKKLFSHKRALVTGMLLLGAAYLLSGIFSKHYSSIWLKNMGFGGLQFLAIFAMYFLLTALVDWSRVRKDYFIWIGFLAGCVIAIEVFNLYLCYRGEFWQDGIDRWKIYLGWGIHNNIGAMLAVTSPFAFYLACQYKYGYFFIIPAAMIAAAMFLTFSRTSILMGIFVLGVSFIFMLRKGASRKVILTIGGGLALAGIALVILFWGRLVSAVKDIFDNGFLDGSGRSDLYFSGFKVFVKNSVLGDGFYPTDQSVFEGAYWFLGFDLTSFFPPRWHNTIVQLLASCGIFGLITYGIHRVQTVFMFLRKLTREKIFIGLSVLALLGMSLLDNHFFNLGPTLFYSLALAFAEKSPEQADLPGREIKEISGAPVLLQSENA